MCLLAPSFAAAEPVQAPLAISVGGCAVVVNSGSGGLAVRATPSTSGTLIKRIPDGTKVKILEGPRSANGYTWWRHDQGGWSAGSYLSDIACTVAPRDDAAFVGQSTYP